LTMRAQDPEDGEAAPRAGERTQPTEARVQAPASLPGLPATVLGWLTPASTAASLFVDFPGNARGPIAARATIALDEATIHRALAKRQSVALVFERGDAGLPIVLGLLHVAPSPLDDLLRGPPPASRPPVEVERPARVEARVDGRRVTISADEEITLKCGEAALTLRRDGKILLRGAYVETYARGTNRIKGAQVKIN
jgi:uncharacterized protein DUF6484